MPVIQFDDYSNCYEELGVDDTVPTESYVWFFAGKTPLTPAPQAMDTMSLEKMQRIADRYTAAGYRDVTPRFFLLRKREPKEEECRSPGCKRRMKYEREPCYWCGRI